MLVAVTVTVGGVHKVISLSCSFHSSSIFLRMVFLDSVAVLFLMFPVRAVLITLLYTTAYKHSLSSKSLPTPVSLILWIMAILTGTSHPSSCLFACN